MLQKPRVILIAALVAVVLPLGAQQPSSSGADRVRERYTKYEFRVPMRDGGHVAASLWQRLSATYLASPELQVRPRLALPIEHLDCTLDAAPTPLIKGYLRLGAKLLGPPAWDPDFQTADLPMLLCLNDLPGRYRRHFLGAR